MIYNISNVNLVPKYSLLSAIGLPSVKNVVYSI